MLRLKIFSWYGVMRSAGAVVILLGAGGWALREMTNMPVGVGEREHAAPNLELAGELERAVRYLCHKGGRSFQEPENLERAASYIEDSFKKAGYDTRRERVLGPSEIDQGAGVEFFNIIAEKRGSGEILLIGAHYDTAAGCGVGADDNASGVAGLIAIGKILGEAKTEKTIRLVAFVNEEPPFFGTDHMGSQAHAKAARARGENILCMISLEMIGFYSQDENSQQYPYPLNGILRRFYPTRGDFIAIVGDWENRSLVRTVLGHFREISDMPAEGIALPRWIPGVDWSDHSSFWESDYPALMVTDTALYRNHNYHTGMDTPDTLDYSSMAKVVEGLGKVLAIMADGGL